jgi:hypothetical protein
VKTWHVVTDREQASEDILDVYDAVIRQLGEASQSAVHILSVALEDSLPDYYKVEIEVRFSDEIKLIAVFDENWCGDHNCPLFIDDFNIAAAVVDSVEAYLNVGTSTLGSQIRSIRSLIGSSLQGWHAEGVNVRLVDIKLLDAVRGDVPLRFQVTLGCLDELLRPDHHAMEVGGVHQVAAMLDGLRPTMKERFSMYAELREHGGDCFIDLLAANLIASRGSVASLLDDWLGGSAYPDLQGVTVFSENGRVRAHNGNASGDIDWNRDTVTIWNQTVPETALLHAIGRPVTDLIDHPLLSREMTIVAADVGDESDPYLRVTFEQPLLLFTRATGKLTRRNEGCRQLPLI